MKYRLLLFVCFTIMAPTLGFGACSVANLTRCLDSVCAINIGANPAARCQYCGSSSAGEPTKSTGMKSISAGASAKYTISDKELKKAPTDPGERYIWGTKQCLEKVSGCTPDDVSDSYDKSIEQSCTAAGISAGMTNLAKKANAAKTQSSCSNEISVCIVDDKRCTADYKNCESDENFDKYFSECSIASVGCDSFLSDIRKTLTSSRDSMIANAEKILNNIVASYQKSREQKLSSIQTSCHNDASTQECIDRVCANNMRMKCKKKNENDKNEINYELTAAKTLCEFYTLACQRLK